MVVSGIGIKDVSEIRPPAPGSNFGNANLRRTRRGTGGCPHSSGNSDGGCLSFGNAKLGISGTPSQRWSMHSFGAVFVEVAVDPDLGETRVRRIVGAYGAGRIVNPKTARSQCIGGMIGGIGMGLMEHSVVDGRKDRKSTRLNSSHLGNSYAVFC